MIFLKYNFHRIVNDKTDPFKTLQQIKITCAGSNILLNFGNGGGDGIYSLHLNYKLRF